MPPTADDVRRIITEAVRPGHFFVRPPLRLEWEHRDAEEISWEVFRGRLLDPAQTRQRRTFEAWNVYLVDQAGRSTEPLLSVKLGLTAGELHIVRSILSYVHEAYDAGGNVILTREVQKWVRELVGSIHLDEFADTDELAVAIKEWLFLAVVGTSRLPLTSVEAPLPAFSLGDIAYFHRTGAGTEPMRSYRDLLQHVRLEGRREWAKFLEAVLHAMPPEDLPDAFPLFERFQQRGVAVSSQVMFQAVRLLFNEVSLSPWTDLPERALSFARRLAVYGGHDWIYADLADLLAHLLRQTCRHLTAYDLVHFHHAGANYPDALLLDAVLRELLALIERRSDVFLDAADDDEPARKAKRLRRRGLRQAWLLRRRYRGHPVPEIPTSPGENLRVLPAPHERIPEEQITQPHRRPKQIFTEEMVLGDTAAAVLRQSILDLQHPLELRELGTALYLDRPLGAFKAPGEPDQTFLLSYVAFSRSIAVQRLFRLGEETDLLPPDELATLRQALDALPVSGVPIADVPTIQRPGVVSLADAARTAPDFILLRTTSLPAHLFLASFRFEPLGERLGITEWWGSSWFILGSPEKKTCEIIITLHEADTLRKRIELSMDPRDGYIIRDGVEFPRKGLRVRRVWEEIAGELQERDLTAEALFLRPV